MSEEGELEWLFDYWLFRTVQISDSTCGHTGPKTLPRLAP